MGKFVIKKTSNSGFVFNLIARNGEVIGTSQTYRSLKSAKNGIESVIFNRNSQVEDQTLKEFETLPNPKWEIYADKKGEYRFRLKAMNGEIILASEGYTTKTSAKNVIETVRKNCEPSEIVEPKA